VDPALPGDEVMFASAGRVESSRVESKLSSNLIATVPTLEIIAP